MLKTLFVNYRKLQSFRNKPSIAIHFRSSSTIKVMEAQEITHGDKVSGHLKSPRGMRDLGPAQVWQRNKIFSMITSCFERHGALPIDTPVCELREVLAGNYGEESKLIYNIEDKGGELLSLRYDLTVPFARYLGQNKIQAMTRYHIAKVYRFDAYSRIKGRYREFYQCDIDFAGKYDLMMPDAECLEILCEILNSAKLPYQFSIKINHRYILTGMFKYVGVPKDKFKTICSSIDKLDKMSWEEVKKEMCNLKGLNESVADKIGSLVSKSGDESFVDELLNHEMAKEPDVKKGLDELKTLFKYTNLMGISKYLKLDLSLARGLDYYTGIIYEAIVIGENVEVGSVAAGGRYDNLVSSLLDCPGFHVPCVGLSVGVERLFALLEDQESVDRNKDEVQDYQIQCYVGSIGDQTMESRFRIVSALRSNGVRARNVLKTKISPLSLYQLCEKDDVPYAVFFGKKDLLEECVTVRHMAEREDDKVKIDELVDYFKNKLNIS